MRVNAIALLMFAVLLAAPAAADDVEPKDLFGKALAGVTLGEGIRAEQLTVFPLITEKEPEPLAVDSDRTAAKLIVAEPRWPEKRYDLGVANGGERPVLLLGGTIFAGGRLDRMVPRDLLLPAKSTGNVPAIPAEHPRDRRKEAKPFRHAHVAPGYLRERAATDPTRALVPIFVSHFLDFRDDGDERRSLAALDEAARLTRYCLVCRHADDEFKALEAPRVVGFVTAVRGRIHSLELFGTNDLLRSWFHAILHGYTFEAAAIELRAKEMGIPIPGRDDPEKTVKVARKAAEVLLASLARARVKTPRLPDGAIGDARLLRAKGAGGSAIGLDGRLVHAVIHPDNPFEEALFSRPLRPPTGSAGWEATLGALDRREGRGTLTRFEKRLLDRMRARRGR